MDLSTLSLEELQQLQGQIDRELKRRRSRDKREVLQKIKAMAAAGGYSLEELVQDVDTSELSKVRRTVPAKYCHPKNSSMTWTGRGKHPRWVAEELASGKKLADLLIR